MTLKMIAKTVEVSFPTVQGQFLSEAQKGQTPLSLRERRHFAVQVCNSGTGLFAGCCLSSYPRFIILREMNFMAYGLWDLFVTTPEYHSAAPSNDDFTCLHTALVPHRDAADSRQWKQWTFVGTCRTWILGMDMEATIGEFLGRNSVTSNAFHWHLDVYIDSIEDDSYDCVSHALWNRFDKHLLATKRGVVESPIQTRTVYATQERGIKPCVPFKEVWHDGGVFDNAKASGRGKGKLTLNILVEKLVGGLSAEPKRTIPPSHADAADVPLPTRAANAACFEDVTNRAYAGEDKASQCNTTGQTRAGPEVV